MKPVFNTLDRYIIKQFLGTFFFSILLILSIAVVFDINEKISHFLKPDCTLYEIIFHYYINFVPYYANLFSSLFVFLAVIFFTTKLAEKTEIIAILSSGVSFNRLLRPYMFSAAVIAVFSFLLSSFIIPPGNAIRTKFQDKYIKNKLVKEASSIQLEVEPDIYAYIHYYNNDRKRGNNLVLDHFQDNTLRSRLTAKEIEYDTLYQWRLRDYTITHYGKVRDTLERGETIDTMIHLQPRDFLISSIGAETYTTPELHSHIKELKQRGASNIKLLEIELHKRYATIPAAFILTLIGVSLSSRKRRGGMGLSLALGIALSVSYILFMTIASTFSASGSLPPVVAAQLPNAIYALIALYLYTKAPR
ncbi:LptF/LptG family permease [Porphyromonas circumdentaria]|uniref:Lipopolysaccharide export system permease protein n=1 Tax=Porphyromonas circumdentaria TaxID=29524 RepID=A0A1T4LG75_9PORP|nr:LptF/LptG family permease [Porphyromonas circumdentaria]MBB6275269.1 lipopolysaccharide export system permease protein [Porphyromonas circumdentaria]MDO4722052.1 LptF/LptG family permease [Porphyromonas circumdentaria]SJZ53729.1 lipopolysaccharide export system permease protein [Porphyromonas circumdentaria]